MHSRGDGRFVTTAGHRGRIQALLTKRALHGAVRKARKFDHEGGSFMTAKADQEKPCDVLGVVFRTGFGGAMAACQIHRFRRRRNLRQLLQDRGVPEEMHEL